MPSSELGNKLGNCEFRVGVFGEQESEEMRKCRVVVRREVARSTNSSASSQIISSVRYLECQKNHAASTGGYAVDGCREFIATGEEGTEAALICAACNCHRNFHRRDVETEVVSDCSSQS